MYDSKDHPDFTSHSEFACIKLELSSFTQRQLDTFPTLIHLTDQFISRQRAKPQFSAQEYSRQLALVLAEVQMYFTNLVIHLQSFPFLRNICTILQKLLCHYNKINSFSQQHWLTKFKSISKSSNDNQSYSQFTTMQMCLRCSQNLRHQEIKKARYQLYNPIDNPYLLHNPNGFKSEYVQETNQKYLQDKLSELASNVELGQNCMRDMIQQFSCQAKNNFYQERSTQREIDIQLPVMPLLKSLFRHFKREQKNKKEQSVQTEVSNLKDQTEIVALDSGVCVKANIKMAAELNDRSQKIKNMQEKLAQSEKEINNLKNQVSVLTQANYKLHKRNSVLQVELNISIAHSKLTKSIKRIEHPRNYHPRVEEIYSQIESNVSGAEEQGLEDQKHDEKTRKSLKNEVKPKKLELLSPLISQNQNKSSSFNIQSNSRMARMNEPQLYKKGGSTFSIQKNDQLEPQQLQLQIGMSKDISPPKEYAQRPLTKQSKPPKISKGKYRNHPSQHKKWRELVRSQLPSPVKSKKLKRIGTIYKRDQILEILFQEEIKNKDSSADFQTFKHNMNSVIAKAAAIGKENKNQIQQLRHESRQKPKFRQLPKKSAMSIKQNIRNQSASKGFIDTSKISEGRLSHNLNNLNLSENNVRQQLQQIKHDLYLDQLTKLEQKTVLQKSEHQLMTQIMAYLIQLKVQKKNRYESIKQIILSTKPTLSNATSEIDQIQLRLSQIIGIHRRCQRSQGKIYCDHIGNLINSTVNLIS